MGVDENEGNGGKWGAAGIAHGMWVVEGCGGMWLRKMGQKWEENRMSYPFFTVLFSRFSGGRNSSPQFPLYKSAHRTHRRNNGDSGHSPTLTATAAGAAAWIRADQHYDMEWRSQGIATCTLMGHIAAVHCHIKRQSEMGHWYTDFCADRERSTISTEEWRCRRRRKVWPVHVMEGGEWWVP